MSCFVACRDINKIEPAIAFGQNDEIDNSDLPKFLSSIKCNPFVKISLTIIYRNKSRVFVVFLCTLACMVLTMLSVSIIVNKNNALEYTFKERYDFDLAIFCSDFNDLKSIACEDFVDKYEYTFQNDYSYDNDEMRAEVNQKYINTNGIILERGFARRHNLPVGDFVEIKGKEIEVVEIEDQYLCSTQYISIETAKYIGYENPNAILIYLNDSGDMNKALSYASKLNSFLLTIDINSIKLCAEDTMTKIDMPCYIIIAFSGLIGFIIMYNMALISFNKRRKEFSTLRALGTDNYRIVRLLLGESLGELLVALIVSPISFPLISLILTLISSTAEEYVLFSPFKVLTISFIFTLIYTLSGIFMTYRYIKKIDIALELNI